MSRFNMVFEGRVTVALCAFGARELAVPCVDRVACPEFYIKSGEDILGSLPDAWLKARDVDPEAVLSLITHGSRRPLGVKGLLSWLQAPAGQGSIVGWQDKPCSWGDTTREVAEICQLPRWIPLVLEGAFGAQGVGDYSPVVDWEAVARRYLPANLSLAKGAWTPSVSEEFLAGGWPEGLRMACIMGKVAPKYVVAVESLPPAIVAPEPIREAVVGSVKEALVDRLGASARAWYDAELLRLTFGKKMSRNSIRKIENDLMMQAMSMTSNEKEKEKLLEEAFGPDTTTPVVPDAPAPAIEVATPVAAPAEVPAAEAPKADFHEIEESLREVARARVAAGEAYEDVVLDILCRPSEAVKDAEVAVKKTAKKEPKAKKAASK